MRKKFSGSAVPRHYVFVLADGTYVVQWAETRVQDLLSGDFIPFTYDDFGHAVTDGELLKLKGAGRVEHYTRRYIWLFPLPERGRYDKPLKTLERAADHVRAYYVTTPLPKSQLKKVRALISSHQNFDTPIEPRRRDDIVAIFGQDGQPFPSFQEAEDVLQQLLGAADAVFAGSAVALLELSLKRDTSQLTMFENDGGPEMLNLDEIIGSQTDTTATKGKMAVVIGTEEPEEKAEIHKLLTEELEMKVEVAKSGQQALPLLEDCDPQIAIMDLELSDTHGWAFIKKVREVDSLRNLCFIVVSNDPQDVVFALKVAKVTAYFPRPLNLKRLRQKIWTTLRDGTAC